MSARLIPPQTPMTEPYWAAARRGELSVQRCGACEVHSFPPRARCPACGADELAWQTVSGSGSVYTYTVAQRPPHPVLAAQCPLVIAVVELAEGPRLISNVVGCAPEDVTVGMPVRVVFEPIDDSDVRLPVFEPA